MPEEKKESVKTNVFDYMAWRGDIPLSLDGINEVDALIFSILSYLDFPDGAKEQVMPVKDIADMLGQIPEEERPEGPDRIMDKAYELIRQVADSERFGGLKATGFVNRIDAEMEMQFSAVTFLLPEGDVFIAFRGTDNELIGWQEDLSISFSEAVPAQIEAAGYAEEKAGVFPGPIYICGHSKGGNLAVWAAAHLSKENKERLVAVYNNDGPGFGNDFLQREEYLEIRGKIRAFIPESSIVGVLMEHDEYTTIKSSDKIVMQHDPFSWNVLGTKMVRADDRSRSGKRLDRTLNSWIRSMDKGEREAFVGTLFAILMADDAKTLGDIDKDKLKSIRAMQKYIRGMESEQRKQFRAAPGKIFVNDETIENNPFLKLLFSRRDDDQ